MGKRNCVVCDAPTSELVKPFGMLTDSVAAHHYHDDRSIRDAWLKRESKQRWLGVVRVPAR